MSPSDSGETQRVRDSFGRAAASYREHARVQEALADWVAEWLPADRTGSALEIGAGPGVFTDHLLPWAGTLVASDLSPAMCEAGRAALPGVTWRVMDARSPDGGPWDWIFSSSMLQWAEDPEQLFGAWRRRLAPRGRILGGLFAAGSLPELAALPEMGSPVAWRPADAWRRSLEGAGLTVVRAGEARRVFNHPSAAAFLRSLHRVGAAPHRRFTPGRLRRLLARYEERFRGEAGVCATWVFYRFEAERG